MTLVVRKTSSKARLTTLVPLDSSRLMLCRSDLPLATFPALLQ
jgi:hypothetical protein